MGKRFLIQSNYFKVLSYTEEQTLEEKERELYFSKLREYVRKRSLTNTTRGARRVAPKLMIFPLMRLENCWRRRKFEE